MDDAHLDNAAVGADIENLATELVSKVGDGLEMLVLVSESLADGQLAGMEVLGGIRQAALNGLVGVVDLEVTSSDLAVVGLELLEVLGAKDVDLAEQKLTLNEGSVGVVEDSPDGDEILKLSAGLLDNAVLASEDNGHAGQVLDLSVAHNKRVNVEATGSQDTRDTGQDTGLVLDQTVEDVALGRSGRRDRGLVEDVGDGGLSRPDWRAVAHGQRRRATTKGLVGDGRGR